MAHIVLGVLSYLAQQEALKISERTKAGLQRVRVQGKNLGRPVKFEQWKPKLIAMRDAGYFQGRMSRETGLAYNSIKKYLKNL